MAKRSVEENKGISRYLQEISEIKTSKNNNWYFEGKIQTESKQLQRLVVFTQTSMKIIDLQPHLEDQ